MKNSERDIKRKKSVLEYAEKVKNVALTCRYFGISRTTFYEWKRAYSKHGDQGLINKLPGAKNGTHPNRTPEHIEQIIVHLRKTYHFGPIMITWHLSRFHGITITQGGVYQVLKRNGLNRRPSSRQKKNRSEYVRYEKRMPGHHVQFDVKFLSFKDIDGKKIKRFQYTAIDDSTRIRALKVYN
jgi:transposase